MTYLDNIKGNTFFDADAVLVAPEFRVTGHVIRIAKLGFALARHRGDTPLHVDGKTRTEEGAVDKPVAELLGKPHPVVSL